MPSSRRRFIQTASAGAAGLALGGCVASRAPDGPGRTVYIGTYTAGASEGIYQCRLAADGALTLVGATPAGDNPSFLTLDAAGRVLYAVNETVAYDGMESGSVNAFAIAPETGRLSFLDRQASRGGAPCHLALDPTGRFLVVANYVGGNVSALPVAGGLGEPVSTVGFTGSGPDVGRQEAPHAHMALPDPAGRFVLVPDLGTDRLHVLALDTTKGGLQRVSEAALPPGAGPRHVAFREDGAHVYCLNELDSTLTAFAYAAETGALSEVQALSTRPAGADGDNYPAHVVASPGGRRVYASNRGDDTLAVFDVDAQTGALTLVQTQPTGGRWPRHFAVDPSGRFLLAANERSDTLVTFAIEGGRLRPTGHALEVPSPVCVAFA